MKLTIIVPDSIVGIDGEFRELNLSALPANVRAVQWDGVAGHVEYSDGKPNLAITSVAPYNSIVSAWNALTPAPTPEPTLAELKAVAAEAIKAKRDFLTLNGGHKIGNDWYHSNEISLIQQLALNGIANQMLAAGAPDSTVIIATPWKTLSGAYVSLTVGIAKQFVQSALVQQGALFTAAQNKINEVNALTTVAQVQAYDVDAGFPAVYQA